MLCTNLLFRPLLHAYTLEYILAFDSAGWTMTVFNFNPLLALRLHPRKGQSGVFLRPHTSAGHAPLRSRA